MTETSEHTAAACDATSGAACTCGGGCEPTQRGEELSDLLDDAASVGCTITATEAPGQLARAKDLQLYVVAAERRRGSLELTLDSAVDAETVDRFIEAERRCCSFLTIERREAENTTTLTFSSDDPQREPALAAIARLFDPAGRAPTPVDGSSADRRRDGAILGILGIACLACLLPGLLAAGAIGSIAAAMGGAGELALILAAAVATGSVLILRRRSSGANGCGC